MKRKMDMNRSGNKTLIVFMMLLFMSFSLFGCGKKDNSQNSESGTTIAVSEQSLYGHDLTGTLELKYSKEYSVSFYDGGLTLITVGEDRFLLIGDDIPEEALQDEKNGKLVILRKPLHNIYVASSSVMDYFDTLEALDTVTMTSTKAEDWSIEKIRQLVEDDEISYVGKYSMPDYEYILDEECGLAIENQMIYHSPESQEKLETLGIPVLAHKRSDEYLLDARMNLSALCGPPITVDNVVYLDDGDEVKLQTDSGTSLKVIYTPGHTTDSVIFYSEKDSVAFVGDTIFRGSIGNYQYPGGNAVDLQRSIINKIFSLPDDTILCSGHSEQTTVGREKRRYRY